MRYHKPHLSGELPQPLFDFKGLYTMISTYFKNTLFKTFLLSLVIGLPAAQLVCAVPTPNTPSDPSNSQQQSAFFDQLIDQDNDQDDESQQDEQEEDEETSDTNKPHAQAAQRILSNADGKMIRAIEVQNCTALPVEAVLNKVAYQPGHIFNSLYTAQSIRNIYELGFFKTIHICARHISEHEIDVVVIVIEKPRLKEIIFTGNSHYDADQLRKDLKLDEYKTFDEDNLEPICNALKKLYRNKNYHAISVTPSLSIQDNLATVTLAIDEGKSSAVKRVLFEGNSTISSKQLRSMIFTREDWLLGFMNKAGMYHPDAIEADKYTIETAYQSNGFLNARVADVKIDAPENSRELWVTFEIDEGVQYQISSVSASSTVVMNESDLLIRLPIRPRMLYSREQLRQAIELIKTICGEQGYIFADVEPQIETDNDGRTVKVHFSIQLGSQVRVRKISIVGNKKTRDKIIRRMLLLDEGDLLTTRKMELSKSRVESLGYFEPRGGVTWRMTRVGTNQADLELVVQEVKTGQLNAQLSFGGSPADIQDSSRSARVALTYADSNFKGLGISTSISGEVSSQNKQLILNVTEPWLFDRPIFSSIDVAIRRSAYDEVRMTEKSVEENARSGVLGLGYVANSLNDTKFFGQASIEGIGYVNEPKANETSFQENSALAEYQMILDRRFLKGNYTTLTGQVSQNLLNHPVYTSRGYQWQFITRSGLPVNSDFGFFKVDLDAGWYTPLIGERDLVLSVHGHMGLVERLPNKQIPFRELYHIGGPSNVRGYLFGEIGPRWQELPTISDPRAKERRTSVSLGATRAAWWNVELRFPLTADFSIVGLVFYDGGAGWKTPDASFIDRDRLRNNNFSYRHSIGAGVRVYRGTAVRIDYGFKLDRRPGEPVSEVHFTMGQEF